MITYGCRGGISVAFEGIIGQEKDERKNMSMTKRRTQIVKYSAKTFAARRLEA
jgi:hypothetical protein